MSGARDFTIKVTAKDESAAVMSRVDKAIARFDEPLKKTNKGIEEIARGKISDGFTGVSKNLRGVSDLVTNLIPAFGALAGAGVIAGAVSVTQSFAEAGSEIARTAGALGVSTTALQRWRNTAKLWGLDANVADTALQGVADTLRSIQSGSGGQAATLLRRLNIAPPIRDAPINEATITRTFMQLSDAMTKYDAATQRQITNLFGVGGALPMMQGGSAQIREALRIVAGTEIPEAQIKAARDLAFSWNAMGIEAQNTGYKIGAYLAPSLKLIVDRTSELLRAGNKAVSTPSQRAHATWTGWAISSIGDVFAAGFEMGQTLVGKGGSPSARFTGPPVPVPGVPLNRPSIRNYSTEDLARIGRANRVSVSGPDGRLVIHLKVDAAAGLRTRATAQSSGRQPVEVIMDGLDRP